MSSSDRAQAVSDTGATPGPGQRLREAREAAELSQAEVATRLHLDRRTVAHLERDEYDKLPAPTFVRGYLSGYARLLDLPKGPIIEAYERHGHAPPSLVPDIAHTPQVRISDLPMRVVTYLITGLLVVLVVLWWQHRQPSVPSPEELASLAEAPLAASAETRSDVEGAGRADTRPPAAATAPPAPSHAVAEGSPASAVPDTSPADTLASVTPEVAEPPAAAPRADSDPATTVPAPPATAAAGATLASAPQLTSATAPDGGGSPQAAGVDTAARPAPVPDLQGAQPQTPATESTDTTPAAPPIAALPGSDVISIRLARESWVEIYDRGGARLYYSLAHEGSEVIVKGAGPMRVLLGAVDGAAVSYNGENFDLTPFRGRTVARFTVGEEPARVAPAPETSAEPTTPGGQAALDAESQPSPPASAARQAQALQRAAPVPRAGALPAVDSARRVVVSAEN